MAYELNGKVVTKSAFLKNAATATDVWVYNCPVLTALPDLPAATVVRVDDSSDPAIPLDLPG